MQTYFPIRNNLISKDELYSLSILNSKKLLFDIFFDWIIIFFSYFFIYMNLNIILNIFLFLLIGTRIYSLFIIAHDGLHWRFSNSKKKNDLMVDFLILGAFFSSSTLNRNNHILHHRETANDDDPDRFKYLKVNKRSFLSTLLYFSGISSIVKVFKNIFLNHSSKLKRKESNRIKLLNILPIIMWQIILLTITTKFFGKFGYIFFWLLPVYVFSYCADLIRVFCEHAVTYDEKLGDKKMRLINYESNLFERIIFSPRNMNFHAIHHLYQSIPYYNLDKANDIIKQKIHINKNIDLKYENIIWRKSYIGFIINYLLNVKNY